MATVLAFRTQRSIVLVLRPQAGTRTRIRAAGCQRMNHGVNLKPHGVRLVSAVTEYEYRFAEYEYDRIKALDTACGYTIR